ncbi:M24 family metallopeptidase [Kaistia terrae]|uniref:M24 family metallopeptidase n=1 Tax=Kaistia terrae TaxID=537017 RepID=A0ABW0PRV6_9HYPH|nr:Xaa-Pro peptidase family protein [Kaistia terrae]MCX5578422.1 Xaa-Pro peptidase family protein [Kaistia terrae]
MMRVQEARTIELQQRLAEDGIDVAILHDADSIFYFSGFCDYLGMEYDRATLLVIPRLGAPVLITPAMEAELARRMGSVPDVREWTDGIDGEWPRHVEAIFAGQTYRVIGIEPFKTHPRVASVLRALAPDADWRDVSRTIGTLRAIKSPDEIATMHQAGEVAVAMVEGGRAAIAEGVPEYELALAVIAAGTRRAARFLADNGEDALVSPTIYNLQILQSGWETCMVHRRSTVKPLAKGDPIYFCFCGMATFKQFKLGFDREFFLGSATDEQQRTYETVVAAQQAALAEIRPGAIAEDVHAAAEEVYRSAGFGLAYRTGRAIGYSYLEEPQLKRGDKTPLQTGMTFAVDGGITIPNTFGARVGDSIVVTDKGFDYLTRYPREFTIV